MVTETEARNEAVGWLVSAIEMALPGFVAKQAERARGETPAIAAVMEDWAARLQPSVYSVVSAAGWSKRDVLPVLIEVLDATSHIDYGWERAEFVIDALVAAGVRLVVTDAVRATS